MQQTPLFLFRQQDQVGHVGPVLGRQDHDFAPGRGSRPPGFPFRRHLNHLARPAGGRNQGRIDGHVALDDQAKTVQLGVDFPEQALIDLFLRQGRPSADACFL